MSDANHTLFARFGTLKRKAICRSNSQSGKLIFSALVIAMLVTACASSGNEPDMSSDTSAVLWVVSEDPLAPDSAITVDVPPKPIHEVVPEYPRSFKFSGADGVVWMRVLVSDDGTVLGAMVKKSSGYRLLDVAALRAAVHTLYRPAILNGRPLAVWKTYSVTFKAPIQTSENQ